MYVVEMSSNQLKLAKMYELSTTYIDIPSPQFHSKALLLEWNFIDSLVSV